MRVYSRGKRSASRFTRIFGTNCLRQVYSQLQGEILRRDITGKVVCNERAQESNCFAFEIPAMQMRILVSLSRNNKVQLYILIFSRSTSSRGYIFLSSIIGSTRAYKGLRRGVAYILQCFAKKHALHAYTIYS